MGGQNKAPHASEGTRSLAATTISLLLGKWTTEIILVLTNEKQRFAALQRLLPGISHRILTKELKALQTSGIVFRKVYPTTPPSVEYRLSDSGLALCKVLDAASEWATRYLGERPPSVEPQKVTK
jgi:DNA-binding HxlR family transcriptional regulator